MVAFVFFVVAGLVLSSLQGGHQPSFLRTKFGLNEFFLVWNAELYWALFTSLAACITIALVLVREEEQQHGTLEEAD